jgi:eukaryotic-like serine/threonine-protein kinase
MSRLLADRYELGEVVGAGGVARVHRALDHHLQRDVAVKVLDDDQARSADPAGRDRFLREARSAARVQHPHLVTVYDAGEDAGELFLVMELIDGESLAALIARRAPMPVDEAVSIAVQILDGLSAVHADGIIHRDIKPANVLVDRAGRVHLTDFGIAKRLDEIEENLTSSGMVVGTPSYLAPEQAVGGRLSVATDVYLVGLVLGEMLTGRRPTGSALDPRRERPDVPAPVAAAVVRATDRDPGRRFGSAQEMIAALRATPTRVATAAFPMAAAAASTPLGMAPTTVMPGGEVQVTAATQIAPMAVDHVASESRRPGWWLLVAAAAVIALIVGLLLIAEAAPQRPDEPALSTTVGTNASVASVNPVASAPPTTSVITTIDQPDGAKQHDKPADHGKKKKDHKDEDG